MRGRVLIISADFFDYHRSVARAFGRLGYDTRVETYDEPVHPFKGLLKWRHKLAGNNGKETLRGESRRRYSLYLKQVFDEYMPVIVFIYNGTMVTDETLDYFRNRGAKVMIWMYDSVRRADRAMCIDHIDHSDLFCCFEESDVRFYAEKGRKAYFMPLACDTEIYYPIGEVDKDVDILFVGTIYISERRVRILEMLAERFKGRRMLFYGQYKPYFKDPIGWMCRGYRDVFMNRNIAPEEVNRLFSRTRIALNIHNQQTFNGANQRVFEACGAGAYQVCDYNPYIGDIFRNGEVGLYKNDEELIELIDYALKHDMSVEARAGYEIVRREHTFDHRIRRMLELLGEL